MPVEEIKGEPGELIDRLTALMNSDALGERTWYSVGIDAVIALGGGALAGVLPDTGEDPRPGTFGEAIRQRSELVSRDQWFELIQDRLCDLVASGMNEAFLVRSIRDEIRRGLEVLAGSGRDRTEEREHYQRMLEDPAELAAFRTILEDHEPSAVTLSNEKLTAMLRKLARPMSADTALDRWAALASWDQEVAMLLPDHIFDDWVAELVKRNRNR